MKEPKGSSFSDDDLKRLKDSSSHITHLGVDTPLFKALLARLEAAEKVCEIAHNKLFTRYSKEVEAWRKAKGDTSEASNSKGEI